MSSDSEEYLANLPSRKVTPGPGGQGRSHYVVGERGLKIIEELSARGCTLTTIAKALRMSVDAFKACRMKQPEVEAALERGRDVEKEALTSNLRKLADEGNLVANIYLLKSRHQMFDVPSAATNLQVNVGGGVLVVPADITVEDYIRQKQEEGLLDVTPTSHAPLPRNFIPEPLELLPEAPVPGSRPAPSGTTIAAPGVRGERGD